jgi:hypothetical protein
VDFYIFAALKNARVAELVDALVSGTSVSNGVQVRVLFWAQRRKQRKHWDYKTLAKGYQKY